MGIGIALVEGVFGVSYIKRVFVALRQHGLYAEIIFCYSMGALVIVLNSAVFHPNEIYCIIKSISLSALLNGTSLKAVCLT